MFMIYGGVGTGLRENRDNSFSSFRAQTRTVYIRRPPILEDLIEFKRTKYIYFFPLLSFLEQKCIIQRIKVE